MSDFEVVEVGAQRELAELRSRNAQLQEDNARYVVALTRIAAHPVGQLGRIARAALGASLVPERRIRTNHDPSLMTSNRSCDWLAHYDDDDGEGNVGWGATEAEAIADLNAMTDPLTTNTLLDKLRAECNHFVNGHCLTLACLKRDGHRAATPVELVGCTEYRAVKEIERLQAELDRHSHEPPDVQRDAGLLLELWECGAVSNWLRVSDDLRSRVSAAIDAARAAQAK